MGSQIGCGRVCFAHEPKAMRDSGFPDCARVVAGISEAAPARRANVRRENMVDTIMTFCVVWMAAA